MAVAATGHNHSQGERGSQDVEEEAAERTVRVEGALSTALSVVAAVVVLCWSDHNLQHQ